MRIQKQGFALEVSDNGAFQVDTPDRELTWIKSPELPMLPLGNRACIFGPPTLSVTTRADGAEVLTFAMPSNTLFAEPRVCFVCHDDYLEVFFHGRVRRRFALHKWYLLPSGATLSALECLDFRSHINSPDAYEVHQTILGRRKLGTWGLDANTNDSDLMFAPHPMLFVFTNLEHNLVTAPMGLVNAECLQIKMFKGTRILDDFHIRVGPGLFWLEPGEELESPHYMILLTDRTDPFQTLEAYTRLLVREGLVTPKSEAEMQDWWYAPMWCSYGDQHVPTEGEITGTTYTMAARLDVTERINEELVMRAVRAIAEHRLPIRTLILDDRWYTWQGDMRADQRKFPDLRGLVERLHARGFKVLCWASLYQFERQSEVYQQHPEWFVIHHYDRNHHNPERDWPHLDYSDPNVAGPYLQDLMERLLGNGPAGYNFDGIKFDWPFLVPHDYAYPDRDWVGKEKTLYNTQRLIYRAAKAVKPEALIIGVSPHPFFNDTQDIIRTYDVSTSDMRIHLNRARYIRAIAPGMTPALDEAGYHENFFKYMEHACRLGIPMIYNLLCFNADRVWYTEADYRRLKAILDDYVERTPRLKQYLQRLPAD